MSEQGKQKLLQEYRERNNRWTDRTLSQMSFYNNLLLTLGIGFLSFAYQSSRILYLEFSLKDIDCSLTLYVVSILAVTLSVLTGFMASLSRLYDFRITRQVNQIRQRALEHSDKKLDEKTPEEFSFGRSMCLPYQLLFENYPVITLEQCKSWENEETKLNDNFMKLRTISHNLGIGTWSRIKLQTFLLILAVVCYVVSELVS